MKSNVWISRVCTTTVRRCDKKYQTFGEPLEFLKETARNQGLTVKKCGLIFLELGTHLRFRHERAKKGTILDDTGTTRHSFSWRFRF